MEICKVPTWQLKALKKHNITHIIYIEMENVIRNWTKANTIYTPTNSSSITICKMDTHARTHVRTHARAHTCSLALTHWLSLSHTHTLTHTLSLSLSHTHTHTHTLYRLIGVNDSRAPPWLGYTNRRQAQTSRTDVTQPKLGQPTCQTCA